MHTRFLAQTKQTESIFAIDEVKEDKTVEMDFLKLKLKLVF